LDLVLQHLGESLAGDVAVSRFQARFAAEAID
jgi:hypothetical protein